VGDDVGVNDIVGVGVDGIIGDVVGVDDIVGVGVGVDDNMGDGVGVIFLLNNSEPALINRRFV
jgi:hypothetical protein